MREQRPRCFLRLSETASPVWAAFLISCGPGARMAFVTLAAATKARRGSGGEAGANHGFDAWSFLSWSLGGGAVPELVRARQEPLVT